MLENNICNVTHSLPFPFVCILNSIYECNTNSATPPKHGRGVPTAHSASRARLLEIKSAKRAPSGELSQPPPVKAASHQRSSQKVGFSPRSFQLVFAVAVAASPLDMSLNYLELRSYFELD